MNVRKLDEFCSLCVSCQNDCKRYINITECENHVKCLSNKEYEIQIRKQNVNLKRMCKENNLRFYILKEMLDGKRVWKYKYHKILSDRLYECDELLPYLEDGGGDF